MIPGSHRYGTIQGIGERRVLVTVYQPAGLRRWRIDRIRAVRGGTPTS